MTKYTEAKAEAIKLGQSLTEFDQSEFFCYMHSKYYKHVDVSFMKYFLELYESKEDYPVEHTALVKYGIMTSTQSSDVRKKLDLLGLKNKYDYHCSDTCLSSEDSRGVKYQKVYYLTAKSFKICLMRAQRRANQPVDPIIYNNYFLLLEEMHLLHTVYDKAYSDKLISMRDSTISSLETKIDEQSAIMKDQTAKIDKLLGFAQETKEHNEELIDKTDELIDLNKITYDALVHKSFNSTIVPNDLNYQTHFVVYKESSNLCDIALNMRTGTLKYIQSIDDEDKRVFKISPTANGMNLRRNIRSECVKNFSKLLGTTEAANAIRKITGIYFGSYEIRYNYNTHISVNDILDIVQMVYDNTTKPPVKRYG